MVLGMVEVGIGGAGRHGYGTVSGSWLLNGSVAMETWPGSIRQSQRSGAGIRGCRPARSICTVTRRRCAAAAMTRVKEIGSFGLTEPCGVGDLRRNDDNLPPRGATAELLNGQKKWSGNSTLANVKVIWTRGARSRVKGFVVGKDNRGFSVEKIKNGTNLRLVQNDCHVPKDVGTTPTRSRIPKGPENDSHRGGRVCRRCQMAAYEPL
jgi:glutaryl-CoA dehydrogenase